MNKEQIIKCLMDLKSYYGENATIKEVLDNEIKI